MQKSVEYQDFKRAVYLGNTLQGGRLYSVHCKVEYKGGRLSISGVIGATKGGNAQECGQIDKPHMNQYASGWDREKVNQFFDAWKKWHLNDMKAGSPKQTAHLETLTRPQGAEFLTWEQEELKKVGLEPDSSLVFDGKPYFYGTRWLMVHVPRDVLEWLHTLPAQEKPCAWHDMNEK